MSEGIMQCMYSVHCVQFAKCAVCRLCSLQGVQFAVCSLQSVQFEATLPLFDPELLGSLVQASGVVVLWCSVVEDIVWSEEHCSNVMVRTWQ